MSELLVRPEKFRDRIETFGYEYLSFETRRLAAGRQYAAQTGANELAIVVLGGVCSVATPLESWPRIGGRSSVFDGLPYTLYLPISSDFSVTADTDCDLAFCYCRAEERHPARLVTPDEVRVEIRGGGNATRQIHHMLTPEFPAHRLLVVEVFTPAGNWSSYPPHKHDVHNPPGEVDLEEIYYYRLDRPEGYAIQKVYTADRRIDETLSVRDGELVLIPEGYHPVVAAHGYNVYYLNALAGSARSMAASDDPDYAWVRGAWREQDPQIADGEEMSQAVKTMDVVILGRIGYDLYSEEPHVPLPQVRRFSRYLGGSSANMAVGLARLGARVGIVSSLGDDSLSRFLIDFLQAEKVDTAHVQTAPGYLPSLCLTEVAPPDRFPQVFYRHDPVDTMLDVTGDDLNYVTSGSMFVTNGTALCGSPSRESAYRAMERAKNAGCRVVLDVDYRSMSWRTPQDAGLAIRLALPFVDVLIGNQLELRLVAGVDDLDQATAQLLRAGVPMLVSKLGELGTRVLTNADSVYQPPYSVEVCTTIGAGDGFASGFLYAMLKGLPVAECLHYGNAAAAIVVSRLSCSEAMPLLSEVEEMMRQQRKA